MATSDAAVFAAGTVNADLSLTLGAPLQEGASVIAQRLLRTSGGRAGNVAVMARRLDAPARLFGCVGTDDLAEHALAGPRAEGVDLGAVRAVTGATGLAAILVTAGGGKTMIFAPGANERFSERDAHRLATDLRDAARESVVVLDPEVSPSAVATMLEAARHSGRQAILDPTRPDRVTDRMLELSDHVTPNADEAARMTGIAVQSPADAARAAQRLRERGARRVHVRLARGGCFSSWPGRQALLLAPAGLEVIDTTGAGDAFAGTLAVAIMRGRELLEAVRLAVAAAAYAVTGLGAQQSYPDRLTLEELAKRVRTTSHVVGAPGGGPAERP